MLSRDRVVVERRALGGKEWCCEAPLAGCWDHYKTSIKLSERINFVLVISQQGYHLPLINIIDQSAFRIRFL